MSDNSASSLLAFVSPLEELDYFVDHQPAGEDGQSESLWVSLNIADENPDREYGVAIHLLDNSEDTPTEVPTTVFTHFFLVLPFRVAKEHHLDAMRYCGWVNRILPIGAFSLSEQDNAIYLRYCLPTPSRDIPKTIMLEAISAIEYGCQEYGLRFEELSNGTTTVDELLQEMDEAGELPASVGDPEAFIAQ